MNKRKLIPLIASLAAVATIGIGSTLAYFTDSESVNNVVTMGNVNITLTEPLFSENTNNEDGSFTIGDVLPNQDIVKDPTITVAADSADAYIRVKIDITGLPNPETPSSESDARAVEVSYAQQLENAIYVLKADGTHESMSDAGWTYSNGYYYYNTKVAAGSVVKAFDGVVIPADWGNEFTNVTFHMAITAEAIQADYFTPETNGANIIGWNGVTPESYNP